MPLGISPLNDFAFKKTFGSPENRECLMSLLNAVLKPRWPIVDVTIKNPFNRKDFEDDKLSVVDVKATDSTGAIYHVEVQLRAPVSLTKRVVFYGCEVYADQLREGGDYAESLSRLLNLANQRGSLARYDAVSPCLSPNGCGVGRVLNQTLEIHTIELPKYDTKESELPGADLLDWWLYWFRHVQNQEAAQLLQAFPQSAIRKATETLVRIAEITEDKIMHDAREKAIRDRKWELEAAKREARIEGKNEGKIEGKIEAKIETIRMLEGLLYQSLSDEKDLAALGLEQLEALTGTLQEKLRNRTPA